MNLRSVLVVGMVIVLVLGCSAGLSAAQAGKADRSGPFPSGGAEVGPRR
jgi:hypothetical protein